MPIGQLSVEDLAARVDGLEKAQQTTRRENVETLVPAANDLVTAVAAELASDRTELTRLRADFTRRYGAGGGAGTADRAMLDAAEREVRGDETVFARARALRNSVIAEAQPVEVRQNYAGGICGVYNEATGKVEWDQMINAGVAGVYDPETREVVWATPFQQQAVAGARDPSSGAITFDYNAFGGVTPVPSPAAGRPLFERANAAGIALVVDPATNRVRRRVTPQASVVGYVEPETGTVRFQQTPARSGIAVVYRVGDTYRSSCGWTPSPLRPPSRSK